MSDVSDAQKEPAVQRPLIPPPFDAAAAAATYAIAAGVVAVHAAPMDDSEVVTQARLGTPLISLDATADGWRAVQLPDYAGWIAETALATSPLASEQVAVVTALRAPLYESRDRLSEPVDEIYATTVLPALANNDDDALVAIALPGG